MICFRRDCKSSSARKNEAYRLELPGIAERPGSSRASGRPEAEIKTIYLGCAAVILMKYFSIVKRKEASHEVSDAWRNSDKH